MNWLAYNSIISYSLSDLISGKMVEASAINEH